MAAKRRKPGFDVPKGQSDAEWVYRSDPETKGGAAAAPPATTPVSTTADRGTASVARRASAKTYARLPGAAKSVEGKMDVNNATGAQTTPGTLLVNGVKVLGEVAIVPGASLIVDGEVKSGLFHAAGGLLGVAMLGPVFGPLTWLALGMDSYSRSVSGKNIVDQFSTKPKAAQ